MKLFKIRVYHELVVRSEDGPGAIEAAMEAVRSREIDTDPETTAPQPVRTLDDLPYGWSGRCLPFGERDPSDRTIAEQLSVNGPS